MTIHGTIIILFIIIAVLIIKLKNNKYPEGNFWSHMGRPEGGLSNWLDFCLSFPFWVYITYKQSKARFKPGYTKKRLQCYKGGS